MELAKLISDKEEVAVPDDKGDFIIVTMMMLLMVVAHKTALACLIRTAIVMLSSDKRVDNNYFPYFIFTKNLPTKHYLRIIALLHSTKDVLMSLNFQQEIRKSCC